MCHWKINHYLKRFNFDLFVNMSFIGVLSLNLTFLCTSEGVEISFTLVDALNIFVKKLLNHFF